MVNPPLTTLKEDRAVEWLKKGAQPSDAVRLIFQRGGIFDKVNS
jgi:small subunit ribosomal protein S16